MVENHPKGGFLECLRLAAGGSRIQRVAAVSPTIDIALIRCISSPERQVAVGSDRHDRLSIGCVGCDPIVRNDIEGLTRRRAEDDISSEAPESERIQLAGVVVEEQSPHPFYLRVI